MTHCATDQLSLHFFLCVEGRGLLFIEFTLHALDLALSLGYLSWVTDVAIRKMLCWEPA